MRLVGFNSCAVMLDFRRVLFRCGLGGYQVCRVFGDGHTLFKPLGGVGFVFYAIFKRDWFVKFSSCECFEGFFDVCPGFFGEVGESINFDVLERVIRLGCDYVVFIHEDGVFVVSPLQIKVFCEKYGLIRRQKRENAKRGLFCDGGLVLLNEVTYSFPKSLMNSFEDEFN